MPVIDQNEKPNAADEVVDRVVKLSKASFIAGAGVFLGLVGLTIFGFFVFFILHGLFGARGF